MAALEWDALLETLGDHLSPEWMKFAHSHGEQDWVRLVLLVDAHYQLSNPGAGEKVANTMYHLANDNGEKDSDGWEAIEAAMRDARTALAETLADSAEKVLPADKLELFNRSSERPASMQ